MYVYLKRGLILRNPNVSDMIFHTFNIESAQTSNIATPVNKPLNISSSGQTFCCPVCLEVVNPK